MVSVIDTMFIFISPRLRIENNNTSFKFLSQVYYHSVGHLIVILLSVFLGRDHPSCPPPISAQQAQQNHPPRSNFTSLKRSASSLSTGSSASLDRKSDSPKENINIVAERTGSVKKTQNKVT